jgi:hypothetical protein
MKFNERFKSGDVIKVPVTSQVFTGGLNRVNFSRPWLVELFGENPTHANVVVDYYSELSDSYIVHLIDPKTKNGLEQLKITSNWVKGCRKVSFDVRMS